MGPAACQPREHTQKARQPAGRPSQPVRLKVGTKPLMMMASNTFTQQRVEVQVLDHVVEHVVLIAILAEPDKG